MSGLFGVVSSERCSEYLLYGTDYHSHLGTQFGGAAVLGEDFERQIHNISNNQFKSCLLYTSDAADECPAV